MVQAIASELGALFINLSSSTIGNSFEGEEGATRLVHMVFTVAKEKSYGPVVIYLDDCHEFFLGKSKKGVGADIKVNLQRFQKDMLLYKNQVLSNEDRVLVIGCTNRPDLADVKLLRWKGSKGKPEKQGFFERSLYFPIANHSDRLILWEQCIQRKISSCSYHRSVRGIDYDSLAMVSEGFSAAEIASIIDAVISEERLKKLAEKPLTEHDFVCCLSNKQRKPNDEVFLTFTRQITELDSRWKALNAQNAVVNSKRK